MIAVRIFAAQLLALAVLLPIFAVGKRGDQD